jgi:hypothetical protein
MNDTKTAPIKSLIGAVFVSINLMKNNREIICVSIGEEFVSLDTKSEGGQEHISIAARTQRGFFVLWI